MSAFDALDAIMLRTDLVLFGRLATIHPMKTGAAGVNAKPVAETDPARATLTGVRVIRSEWSERVQIGGEGLPTPPGHFKAAARGFPHVASVMPASLAWVPRKGDEIEYDDRPGQRYRIAEPMPDGGAGLHCGCVKL